MAQSFLKRDDHHRVRVSPPRAHIFIHVPRGFLHSLLPGPARETFARDEWLLSTQGVSCAVSVRSTFRCGFHCLESHASYICILRSMYRYQHRVEIWDHCRVLVCDGRPHWRLACCR